MPAPIDPVTVSERDRAFLRRAVELAWVARRAGDGPFGSLLVDAAGAVLAERVNSTISDRDISAHPELKLAVWAARHLAPEQARTVTMYTSTECCAMCSGAFAFSGLGRLVFAVSGDQARAIRGAGAMSIPAPRTTSRPILEQATYPITVVGPALYDEGRTVLEGWPIPS